MKKLGEICDIRMGETLIKKDLTGEGTPVFSASDKVGPWGFTSKNKLTFGENSIILSARGNIGLPRLPKIKKFTATQTTIVITNKSEKLLDTIFLWELLQAHSFADIRFQAAIPMITIRDVSEIEIPLPTIEEQKRIVKRIEGLFAKIDEAQKLREESKKSAATLLQSALKEIFSGSKSKNWDEKELKFVLEICDSGTWGVESSKGVPFLRSSNMQNGSIIFDDLKYIILPDEKKEKYILKEGDILITKSSGSVNHIGKSIYINKGIAGKFGFSNFTQRLRVNKNLAVPRFIYFIISNQKTREFLLKESSTTTGLRNLKIKALLDFKFLLPSIAEQKKIVVYLDSLSEKVRKLQDLQQKTADDFKNLKKSILAKVFKGQL